MSAEWSRESGDPASGATPLGIRGHYSRPCLLYLPAFIYGTFSYWGAWKGPPTFSPLTEVSRNDFISFVSPPRFPPHTHVIKSPASTLTCWWRW